MPSRSGERLLRSFCLCLIVVQNSSLILCTSYSRTLTAKRPTPFDAKKGSMFGLRFRKSATAASWSCASAEEPSAVTSNPSS